jgi:hypothetical protein
MKLRLLLSLFCTAALPAFAQYPTTPDETARFLAGLPVDGALAPAMELPAWQQHAREMDQAWAKKQSQQIVPIRNWMWMHAEPYIRSTDTMYYMFGGPDFLYANIFFPYASTYILAGLEPVGQVPDLTQMPPEQLAAELATMRGSMSTILRFQYFITKDMREDLGRGHVAGTLPILYVFLARLGYAVLEVAPMKSPAEGVRITFKDPAREQTQTLYYFKTDLSGGGNSAFLKWCAGRGPGLSLLKAASYLMHTEGFNGVRNFLLQNSKVIVQDDSGIPLRAFPKRWVVSNYGRYVPHGEMFGKYHQPDLAAIYQSNPPSELGFAFGYHWQAERGILMLATPSGSDAARREPEVRKALPVAPEQQTQKSRVRE